MSDEQEKSDRGQLQHEAEHAKPRKKGAVMIYLAILFGAAFFLLLMSYFMQQRVNDKAIDGLKETSTSAVQSLENLLKERDSFQSQVGELESQKELLERELGDASAAADSAAADARALEDAVAAMDYLRRVQQFYYAKSNGSARMVIEKFEASGLVDALPTEAVYQNESNTVLSPAEEYQKIYDALF